MIEHSPWVQILLDEAAPEARILNKELARDVHFQYAYARSGPERVLRMQQIILGGLRCLGVLCG